MTKLTTDQLEALGISRDELIENIIQRCSDDILSSTAFDEDGNDVRMKSDVEKRLQALCKETIDRRVQEIAETHILPVISQRIDNLVLQQTNTWGEKTGKPVPFIEYLVQRADAYLTEKVNYEGKSKAEVGGYSFSGDQSRITHMVHKHLHYSIETAMKNAVSQVNAALSKGLQETVKLKIDEIVSSLKVVSK